MSRSVSVPSSAEIVCYQEHGCEYSEDWDYFIEDIQYTCQKYWPSLENVDTWIGRENHVILENGHAQIGISEYCGLASIWIVPQISDYYPEHSGLAYHWIDQIAPKFKECFSHLQKLGHFSNGSAVYKQID